MTRTPEPLEELTLLHSERDARMQSSPGTTSFTAADSMLSEMPLDDEDDEPRRELRAQAREEVADPYQAKAKAARSATPPRKLKSAGLAVSSMFSREAFSALGVLNRKKQKEQEAQLIQDLTGEWEIQSGLKGHVWGRAVITRAESVLITEREDRRIPCSFEGSLKGTVTVRWGTHHAALESANLQKGKLTWRRQPLHNGTPGGHIVWRRLQADGSRVAPRTPKKRKQPAPPKLEESPRLFHLRSSPRGRNAVPAVAVVEPYEVVEVVSDEHKERAFQLHREKLAFANEHEYLRVRLFDNENGKVQCRSWLLSIADGSKGNFVAAATVRVNPYINKEELAWAQIMNVSVSEERRGYGTRLVAGVEELLWRERVDVIALYPVPNNRADSFWTSMGYKLHPESLLSEEELDPRTGGLLQEGYMEKGVKKLLPRWEKQLIRDYAHPSFSEAARKRRRISLVGGSECDIDSYDEATWKALPRVNWPLWRRLEEEQSKLDAEELGRRFEHVQQERMKRKVQERETALCAASTSFSCEASAQ